ncbi:MAG: hypothetical protein WCT40_02655 [Candidatus Magasanikbacteria bacterium]
MLGKNDGIVLSLIEALSVEGHCPVWVTFAELCEGLGGLDISSVVLFAGDVEEALDPELEQEVLRIAGKAEYDPYVSGRLLAGYIKSRRPELAVVVFSLDLPQGIDHKTPLPEGVGEIYLGCDLCEVVDILLRKE